MRLVLASNNAKKLVRAAGPASRAWRLTLVTQGELGIGEAEEPHATFIENALAKARHAAAACERRGAWPTTRACASMRWAAQPGVISAHFTPALKSRRRATAKDARAACRTRPTTACCSQRIAGVSDRRCALRQHAGGRASRAGDPEPLVAVGRWEGEILQCAARRSQGFGYDPLMFIPALGKYRGRTGPRPTKNAVSHRAPCGARRCATLLREAWQAGLSMDPLQCRRTLPAARHAAIWTALPPLSAVRAPALVPEEVPLLRFQLPCCGGWGRTRLPAVATPRKGLDPDRDPDPDRKPPCFLRPPPSTRRWNRATSTPCAPTWKRQLADGLGPPRADGVHRGRHAQSVLARASIDRLLADVRARLPLDPGAEITLEANPGTFESRALQGLFVPPG
jgi:XTP/dITP diphosphohydrolase